MNRIKVFFENGFGASIIEGDFSYGVEVATLDHDNNIVGDVEGFLNGQTLIDELTRIKNL